MNWVARRLAESPSGTVLERAGERARSGLEGVVEAAAGAGMPRLRPRGQLIRPVVAVAGLGEAAAPGGFWTAVLAVQMAHEASLVHDDIVDGAATRRGEPTAAAARGVGTALVQGDHLLTAAYRLAAQTGSLEFAALFARALERTVAGEIAQGRSIGRALGWNEYREIALGKAGELLGCALAAAPALRGEARAGIVYELGRRLGLLYQMLDDLLDYCPATGTGKPALGDYAQGRWTWPLLELDGAELGRDPRQVAAALSAPDAAGSALRRCLRRLEEEAREFHMALDATQDDGEVLAALVGGWLQRARDAVVAEERASAPGRGGEAGPRPSRALRDRVPGTADLVGYFARNSRSFRFAARFFPRDEAERVARVYAYCRVTDDLVDRPTGSGEEREALLSEWVQLSRRAYAGEATGLAFVDRVMGEMAGREVPFRYAAELAEGMRMDLRGTTYETLSELRLYTYRVASVVGLWLTESAGVRDPAVLARAAALGHAMQLTNILRDVGEDARRGRIYLPGELMRQHAVERAELERLCASEEPIGPHYRALVEELLAEAERSYQLAFRAVPCLPPEFRRAVAVAAHVYRGIHREIRRNGHDNLRRRAVTSPAAKGMLAVRALWELRGLRRQGLGAGLEAPAAAPALRSALHLGREL